jgi:hypothetical protein
MLIENAVIEYLNVLNVEISAALIVNEKKPIGFTPHSRKYYHKNSVTLVK